MTSNNSVLEVIEQDDFLKTFIHPHLQNIALEHSNQLFSVNDQIAKLSKGIESLNKEIERQVLDNHEDLLFHATWIEKLEEVLDTMSIYMQSLLSGIERISSKVVVPFQKMEEQNLTMENILKTLKILRRVGKIQIVSHRLPSHITSDADVLKVSQNIKELDQLWSEINLSEIKVLDLNQRKLSLIKQEVSEKAKVQLLTGLKKHKLSIIRSAVQIFYDLHRLEDVVKEFIDSSINGIKKVIDENFGSLLDSGTHKDSSNVEMLKRGPGKAAMPTMGNASSFRPRLWSAIDEIFEHFCSYCIQVEILEASLHLNRNDFISVKANTFIETFPEDFRNITEYFWKTTNSYLANQLNKCSKSCKFVKEALEGEYPRFLRLYMDLCKKLQTNEKSENFSFQFAVIKDVVAPFEHSYLANLDSVVSYPVHNMFSTEVLPKPIPSSEDIDSLIRIIRSELSVALFDSNLSSTIARNITKSIGAFCSLCEEHIVVQGPDAVQVIGSRKAAQERNIGMANQLEYLKVKLKNVTASLGMNADAAEILNLSLITYADSLITKIISTMLDSVVQSIKKIILTMHVEDFSRCDEKETSISLYMRELTAFVARSYSTYLKPFESQEVLRKCSVKAGIVCVEYFLRHISLIKPLSSKGRIRLTLDCNEFEIVMAPLLGEEPKSYRMLRLFKLILITPPAEILNNSAIGETVPYSWVLFYLFSYATDELKPPHESGIDPKIKSIETLSEFLDNHQSEKDRIDLINKTLIKYSESVRQIPGKNFDPIYGVMALLLQKCRVIA